MLNFLGGVLTGEEEHISWPLILPGSELVKGCSNNAPFLANFPRMLPPGKIRHFCTGIYSNMYKHCQWETRSIWNTTMVHICMYVGCTLN